MAGVGLGICLTMAYPNFQKSTRSRAIAPKCRCGCIPDNVLIAEFGEERRNVVHFKDIPDVMRKAVLAIEDDRFYEHGGVDYIGIARAAFNNVTGGNKQGASTITQQVARNFFFD